MSKEYKVYARDGEPTFGAGKPYTVGEMKEIVRRCEEDGTLHDFNLEGYHNHEAFEVAEMVIQVRHLGPQEIWLYGLSGQGDWTFINFDDTATHYVCEWERVKDGIDEYIVVFEPTY